MWLPVLLNWDRALEQNALMDTALAGRKIHIDRVGHAPIVPQQHVANPLGMLILVFRLRHMGVNLIE